MPPYSLLLATFASTLLLGGCSSAFEHRAARPDPDRFTITAEQIERSGARTAWDALRLTVPQLSYRQSTQGTPRRITRRGQSSIVLRDEIRVYLDQMPLADVGVLRQLSAFEIESIKLVSGLDATTYYGTNSGDGVVLIRTKTGL